MMWDIDSVRYEQLVGVEHTEIRQEFSYNKSYEQEQP